jgi:porphobilinogen deaminase
MATEILQDRKDLQEILSTISDKNFAREIEIEREFLAELSADCDSPVGAYISKKDGLNYCSFLYAPDMKSQIRIIKKTFDSLEGISGKDIAREILSL